MGGSDGTMGRIAGDLLVRYQGSKWAVQCPRSTINRPGVRGFSSGLGERGDGNPLTVGHEQHALDSPYLHMVGPQHNPATEAIAQVDDSHTAAETHDAGQGHPQCGDENLWQADGWGGSMRVWPQPRLALRMEWGGEAGSVWLRSHQTGHRSWR